jgi:two-component system sensor histidine kinase BaeS
MLGVVTLAVVVAALVSLGLVRQSARVEARAALSRQADLVTAILDSSRPADLGRALRAARRQSPPVAWTTPGGTLVGDALPRTAYQLLARSGSVPPGPHDIQVRGRLVLVEVRPLASGRTLVFARGATEAGASLVGAALPRFLVALAAGLAVAAAVAMVFARRLAAPLRRTAQVAHALAAGEREARVVPEGPREVAEVGESLNSLAESLGRSEHRQREFLLSVSHELRTPLTAIRGFAESLADGVTTGAEVPRAGRTITAEADRLARLVSDLLDLARLGAEDFRYEYADVDLRDLVSGAAEVWSQRSHAEGVAFALEVPAGPVVVTTDAARVRQVVDGLAENALRVTPAGRPLVLALRTEPGWAVLEVRDGGPGLTEEDMVVAFERSELYRRYRGVRRVGTGLGLALVRALVVGMGGTVQVSRAEREGGSRFAVWLPRLPHAPAPGASGSGRPQRLAVNERGES